MSDSLEFSTKFKQVDSKLHCLERHSVYKHPHRGVDVLASSWFLIIVTLRPGQLKIFNRGEWTSFCGKMAFFAPPYSVVEYLLEPGLLEWIGYGSVEYPSVFPRKPMAFQWPGPSTLTKFSDVEHFLTNYQDSQYVLERKSHVSIAAEKAKDYLVRNFKESVSIAKMSYELELSYSTMTQDFKKFYGLSPKEYLKKVRLMYALHSLKVKKQSIGQCCFDSGFSDLSRFSQSFKSTLGTLPSKYE